MTEHTFGSREPFAVGIEEELLLVDGEYALAPVSVQVLEAMDADPSRVDIEAYAAQLELRSRPAPTVAVACEQLRSLRATAQRAGAALMGSGLHPNAALFDAPLVAKGRYRGVGKSMRGLLQRTPEAALHIHVGVPDPETAIRVANGLRFHLPVLAGLSANSPYWFGRDSGLESARAAVVRAYPRRGVPPAFADFADYAAAIAAITRAGELDDYTMIWWDVRPHPRLGTVEVRELDSQFSLADVAAIAALVQCLARHESEGPPAKAKSREVIAESCFRATRDGLNARILHGDGLHPIQEVIEATLRQVSPYAQELGAAEALDGIRRIAREGNGAARQRASCKRQGMPGLCAMLVEQTQSATL